MRFNNNHFKNLITEIAMFSIIGIAMVSLDYLFYSFLKCFFYLFISKAISYIVCACLAFILNKYLTFKGENGFRNEFKKMFIVYVVSLFSNVTINQIFLLAFNNLIFNFTLAWVCATAISTIINYLGQKFWVFKKLKINYGNIE